MPKAEDMNTINKNGKAWDGRRGPIFLAAIFIGAIVIGAIAALL